VGACLFAPVDDRVCVLLGIGFHVGVSDGNNAVDDGVVRGEVLVLIDGYNPIERRTRSMRRR
jgi:hypothetical protein